MSTRPASSARAARRKIELQIYEWSSAGPDTHIELAGLTLAEDPAATALVKSLSKQGVVDVVELRGGLRVETGSYVGRIAVGPLNISILPKMAWQRWIGLFGYALRLRGLVRTKELAVRTSPTSLHDLVILELLAEARDLVGRGLHREYVRHREDLVTPRGRIDFNRIARRGGIREAAIPCRFTRRSDDFHLNRVLLAGLQAASAIATDAHLRSDVRRLAHQLSDSVGRIELTRDSVTTVIGGLDRRTARYAPALELVELLRSGMIVSIERPDASTPSIVRGFALDMNALWQQLLARVLREWLPNLEIREEHSLRDLIRPDPDYSPRRRSGHAPRPDFAVFQAGHLLTYLDAKYRDIWEKGLPRDMLYQLALYAAAHGGGTSAILYPTEHVEAAEERLRIHDQQDDSVRATVALRPVIVSELERLLTAPMTHDLLVRRSALATRLLHGREA